MKKRLLGLIMVCSMLAMLLCSCGSTTVAIDPGTLADDIYSGITWQDQISKVDLNKALNLYGINSGDIAAGQVYISTNATAEEIAVLEAASSDKVDSVKASVEARIASQKASFESYNAAEVPKLDNAIVLTKGNYVILVVCNDTDTANSIIDSAFTVK